MAGYILFLKAIFSLERNSKANIIIVTLILEMFNVLLHKTFNLYASRCDMKEINIFVKVQSCQSQKGQYLASIDINNLTLRFSRGVFQV